ncbi:hypothetical protein Mapa_015464 [Marchantia paleacea]|nr:hypothetical protein Mapa_015464 [Marchantia paleacea]
MGRLLLIAYLAQLLLTAEANGRHVSSERESGYRSNEQLFSALEEFSTRCSNISRLYSIGKSVKGVPLLVLEISDKPGELEPEPAFKYVGNMHGDEPSGRELILLLAEWLCSNYLKDPLASQIVKGVHLHLLPAMNPDGFELRERNNANDVDLNRDFPDQFFPDNNNESARQPETRAVMEWIRKYRFTASASLHEGALVASYGWDGTASGRTGYAKAPDDGAFAYMASLYAQYNPAMRKNGEFNGGVTNGAAWYPLYGGMQDWNYIHGNCFEITLEMNDEKWPHVNKIPALWDQHKRSMLMLVASLVKSGVHGRVISAKDARSIPAVISVTGNNHDINASSQFGDFHRILPPGRTYAVTASSRGYVSRTRTIALPNDKAVTVDFFLDPITTSDTALGEHPLLRGSTRTRQKDKSFEEVAIKETSDQTVSRSKIYDEPDKTSDTMSMEETDLVSGLNLDHLRLWIISSFGATVVVLAALMYVLIRWRGSFRSHVLRPATRRI